MIRTCDKLGYIRHFCHSIREILRFHDRPEFERIHHITYFFVTIFFVIHKCLNLNAEMTPIVSLCIHNDNLAHYIRLQVVTNSHALWADMAFHAECRQAGVAAASRRRMRATPANYHAKAGRLRHTARRLKM